MGRAWGGKQSMAAPVGSSAVLEVSWTSSMACHLGDWTAVKAWGMLSKQCLIVDQEMVNDYKAPLLEMWSLKLNWEEEEVSSWQLCVHIDIFIHSHIFLLISSFLHKKKGHSQPLSWCLVFSSAWSAWLSLLEMVCVRVCLASSALPCSPPACQALSLPHLAESPLGSAQHHLPILLWII